MNTTSHGRIDSRSRGADSRSRTRATTSAATDASILAGPRRRRILLTPSWTLRLGSVDLFAAPSKPLHHYTNRRENPYGIFPRTTCRRRDDFAVDLEQAGRGCGREEEGNGDELDLDSRGERERREAFVFFGRMRRSVRAARS
jgi:hypothetical protein